MPTGGAATAAAMRRRGGGEPRFGKSSIEEGRSLLGLGIRVRIAKGLAGETTGFFIFGSRSFADCTLVDG